jgi:hypothetical protein
MCRAYPTMTYTGEHFRFDIMIKSKLVFPFLVAASAIATWLFVRSRPAYRQPTDQVATREPGCRFLGIPHNAHAEATKDADFALLAVSAYQKTPDAEAHARPADCLPAEESLRRRHWKPWKEVMGGLFPDGELQARFTRFHLRVEVWVNEEQKAVVVGFGGTVFNNRNDWRANLRWFLPKKDDEYTATVTVFAPAFIEEFLKQRGKGNPALQDVSLYSTGHSLGAGLAEEFAYALPPSEVPRVKHVFAFDATPVTGFTTVDVATREANVKGLAIDRIYERREALAILRSVTNFFWKPSSVDPKIRQVRYNMFPTLNPFTGHSMTHLACRLDQMALGQGYFAVEKGRE